MCDKMARATLQHWRSVAKFWRMCAGTRRRPLNSCCFWAAPRRHAWRGACPITCWVVSTVPMPRPWFSRGC